VPLLVEAFRTSGAAAVLDASVVIKRRQRGLTPSQLVEGLLALWAAGGERCDDLVQLREASRSGPTTEVGPGSQGSPGAAARARPAGAADRTGLPRGVRRGAPAALARRAVPRPRRGTAAAGAERGQPAAGGLAAGAGAAGGGDDRRRRDHPREPEAERPCDLRRAHGLPAGDRALGGAGWGPDRRVPGRQRSGGDRQPAGGRAGAGGAAGGGRAGGGRGGATARRQRALRAGSAALAGRQGHRLRDQCRPERRARGGDPGPARERLAGRERGQRRRSAVGRGRLCAERRGGGQGPGRRRRVI
jgi:translation initiation factor IF-2